MEKIQFQQNLRDILVSRGISQYELASYLGTTQQTISRWIRGINEPDLLSLVRICRFLDTNPNDLLGYNVSNN